MKSILITGGLGYIGSHIITQCNQNNFYPVVIDNFYNTSSRVINALNKLNIKFKLYKGSFSDNLLLDKIFNENSIYDVIHLAALKDIGESFKKPNFYLNINFHDSVKFINYLLNKNIKNFIFSSSACLYQTDLCKNPIEENSPVNPNNPYGISKLLFENYLKKNRNMFADVNIKILRYFNPIGAHPSGYLGEFNWKNASNIIPQIIKSYLSNSKIKFNVYGSDYPTSDGSAIRDYVDVNDIAEAHLKCLSINAINNFNVINLGSGVGTSVFELLSFFNLYTKHPILYNLVSRRKGDIESIYADDKYALESINWKSKTNIKDSVKSILKFIKTNEI
jgi:UDP-glucose 4-epimerase